MFDTGQDLPLGGGVTLQFVGDDHPWDILQPTQQLAEEAPGSLGVTSFVRA
jgi:hypothetical protein